MRELDEVIKKIIAVVPESEAEFRIILKSRLESVNYCPPDRMHLHWKLLMEAFNEGIPKFPEKDWQKKATEIFLDKELPTSIIADPLVFKVLDVITTHMTEDDNQVLELNRDTNGQFPVYELLESGWLVYIGEMEDNWNKEVSAAFWNVLKEAKKLGCDYVRFDRDGSTYDELPVFDW